MCLRRGFENYNEKKRELGQKNGFLLLSGAKVGCKIKVEGFSSGMVCLVVIYESISFPIGSSVNLDDGRIFAYTD